MRFLALGTLKIHPQIVVVVVVVAFTDDFGTQNIDF